MIGSAASAEMAQVVPAVFDATPFAGRSTADGFYVHLGPGALVFDASAVVRAGGAVIPGGSVAIAPNVTAVTELGYRRGIFGVSLTGGLPPRATVDGAGSLASLGTLGRIHYGPTVLTAHYHYPRLGWFQPYLGAGPVLLLIFKNGDGAVTDLDVKDHWGFCLQIGAEVALTRRWSLFIDGKKAALKADATALLESAPIRADINLSPLVLSGGLSFHF